MDKSIDLQSVPQYPNCAENNADEIIQDSNIILSSNKFVSEILASSNSDSQENKDYIKDDTKDHNGFNDSIRIEGSKDLTEDRLCDVFNSVSINEENLPESDPLIVDKNDIKSNIVLTNSGICYARYKDENQMPAIINLITKDLSEPYSIYTYRYFIHNWPKLCFLATHEDRYVGAIVCKIGFHKQLKRRGYIAMLAVNENVRRKKIGSTLVKLAIESMAEEGCDVVVLETEVTNSAALNLYEKLGFVRDKRLYRYYLNGVDALRLKLWLT